MADNADEGRLALPPEEVANRLRARYGRTAEILDGEAVGARGEVCTHPI